MMGTSGFGFRELNRRLPRFAERMLLGIAAVVLMVTGALAQSTAPAGQPTNITVGGTPSLLYLPFYAALDLGLFAKEGLDVQLVTMSNAIPAVLSGDVQFSLSGSDAAVISAARGKPTPAVVMFQQRSSLSLVASTAVTLPTGKFPENVRGLKGKTVALNRRGATSENLMKQIFKSASMEEGRDYSVVIIPTPASILLALKSHNVDAAILWPPFQEQAAVENAAYLVIRENSPQNPETKSKSGGVSLQANAEFLKSNPEAVKKVINAIVAGAALVRDFQHNEEKLIDVAIKYTGMSNRQAMAQAVRTVAEFAYPGIDCDSWAAGAQEMFDAKSIPVVPKCEEMTAAGFAPKGPLGPEK